MVWPICVRSGLSILDPYPNLALPIIGSFWPSRLSFSSGKILVVKTAAQVCVALEASEAYQSGLD